MAKSFFDDTRPFGTEGIDPITGLENKKRSFFDQTTPLQISSGRALSFYGESGVGESKFDETIRPEQLPNLNAIRADSQTGISKAFNSVVGGVASGLLTALETVGYIADLDNNINRLAGLEEVDSNWFSSVATAGKQGLEKAMPIYRTNPDKVFDFNDPGFYWSTLKGILDSAVGFAIPGMAVSKGIGVVQKGLKLTKYLEFLKTSEQGAKLANALGSGFITNFAEGKMMGLEQFGNSVDLMKQTFINTRFEDLKRANPDIPIQELYSQAIRETDKELREGKLKEMESIAGDEANKFMLQNTVFMLTDAIGLHGLMKGAGFTRGLLKEKGIGAWAKRIGEFSADNLLLQAGKEGLEEVGQNVLQMEGEYQSAKKFGKDVSDTPNNLADRVYEFATSDKALLEGAMGLFGGGPQRILTEAVSGNLGNKSKAEYQRRYEEQQSQIKDNTEFLNSKLGDYAKAQILRAEALEKGLDNLDEVIKNIQFIVLATENFQRGTTENLERQLNDVINGVTEEERIANGWDEDYQQQAQDQLKELKTLEKEYIKYTRYENQANVFKNRQTRRLLQTDKEKVQTLLDNINQKLEFQEVKDPELLNKKATYEQWVKQANEYINDTDNTYHTLISFETQEDIRKEKRNLKAKAKEIKTKRKIKAKKEAQEEKATERKKKNEKKATKAAEKEPSEDIDVSVLSEDTTPLPTNEPPEDAGPDVDLISPEEADNQAKINEGQQSFDKISDDLMNDLETELTPEALVAGEGMSKEQIRLGMVQNMVEEAKKIKGKEKITFDDLIELLSDRHGKKRVTPIFNMLQGLWIQTHPEHKFYADFNEYLKLDRDEEAEINNDKKAAKIKVNDQYTNATAEEADRAINEIQNDIAQVNDKSQGLNSEYLKVESGSGILAYLSRTYSQVRDLFFLKRGDVNNELNSEMEDKSILDPDKYPVGTEITLQVDDDDNLPVYVDPITKSRTTWGAKKDNWLTSKVEGVKEKFTQLFEEEVPIGVYVDGKRIGFLHEVSWINDLSVYGDVLSDQERSRKIRKHIVSNGSFVTTISDRTTGYLFRTADQPITTSEAIPDKTLPMVVAKNGILYNSRNEIFSGNLLNKSEFKEGISYIIVPIGDQQIALPLMNKKISESPSTAKTIRKVLEIFFTEDKSEEAKVLSDEIFEVTGLNIENNLGVSEFIRLFVNVYNTGEADNLQDYLVKNTTVEQSNDAFLTTFMRENNDLQFEIGRGKGIGTTTISKSALSQISTEKFNLIMDKIEEHLNRMYNHTNLDLIADNTKKVVVINEDGTSQRISYKDHIRSVTKSAFFGQNIAKEGQPPKYIYTIQPVITMDFSEIEGVDKETGKPLITKEEKEGYEQRPSDEYDADRFGEEAQREEEKSKPKYDDDYEGGMNFDIDINETLMPESIVPLTTEEVTLITEAAEVKTEEGDEVKGVIISELGITKQRQITDYIRSQVVDKVFKKKRVSRKKIFIEIQEQFTHNLNKLKKNLSLATEINDTTAIARYEESVKKVETILRNWEKLTKVTIREIKRIDNIKVIERDNSITEEEEESINETAHYSDTSAFTTPPTDRVARQVKQFLSGINKWKEDPKNKGSFIPDLNYFGVQKTMDFWDVYNVLQRLTPNLQPSLEAELASLEKYQEAYPFLKEVIVKLRNAPKQLQNQFVVAMTNNYADMKFIMFGQNKETGAYELVEHDSDANSIQRIVLSDWYNKLIERSGKPSGEDDIIMSEEKMNALVATYERWIKTGKYTEKDLSEWLYELGIELTESTWKDLMNGQFVYAGRKQSIDILVKKGTFKLISKNLSTRGATSLLTGNTIVEETVVKALAKHDAKYRPNSYSNSHRSGVKTVYSYTLNKYLVNRVRELTSRNPEGGNSLIDALSKLSFNGQSDWLNQLRSEGEDSEFLQNFEHWVVSLEALKKSGTKSRNNREISKLSDAEIELVKIGFLESSMEDKAGKNNRIIKVLYPTTSDKTTVMGLRVIAQELKLDREGNIMPESFEKLIDLIVRPELQRIKLYQDKKAKGQQADIKGYNKGAEQFLMFPEINTISWTDSNGNIQNMFNEDGSINKDSESPEAFAAIRTTVAEHFAFLVEEKMTNWTKKNGVSKYLNEAFLKGIIAKGANPIAQVKVDSKIKAAATDMVFQYLIANAEIAKLFTGDPALYYKQHASNKGKSKSNSDYSFILDAQETYDNISKRIAADIAPGMELAEADKNIYTQAVLADSKSASLARYEITEILDGKEAADKVREDDKNAKGLISEKYYSFDGTDAQEYTTWQEHLYVLRQLGEISDEDYDLAYERLSKGQKLGESLLGKVMQPMKPVYVDNQIDEASDVEKRIYIKSSSFPLIPQLTVGRQLDKLRIAMENKGISRAAFGTAFKLGSVVNPVNIWNEDGTIIDEIDFTNSTLQLKRKGFRIQQRVPYDSKKATINKVSQASKNLLVNMLDVEGFVVDWYKNGTPVSGKELQDIYHKKYQRLYEIERDRLIKEVGYDPIEGKIANIAKLRALLIEESRERNYPLLDQELLELDKEFKFLAFSSSANKYESLLNSLVTNNILHLKFPGKSFVLGSEEGFKDIITDEKKANETINKTEGIIFTKNWNPKKGLQPARSENGIRKASQALIPWKFKTKDGRTVDIKQYIDSSGLINLDKLPEELLNIFGMRIPNQGPNSQGWIEVVGFLPETSGDLIIASRDFVVQMGSDFDVDKLYVYMYSYWFDETGKINVHREIKKTNESDVLKNQIIDIHLAIHKNPDKRVQSQIANPLGTWELSNIATNVDNIRKEKSQSKFFTGLSDEFQREKFKNATAGKSGISVFSLDSMFNAIAQGKGLTFKVDKDTPLRIQIGDKVSYGDLSGELALDGVTYKSDIIAGYQSAAVDNAKEPILDKLNINTHTFKAIKILNQLGFGEEVPLLITQDIIIDYVKELESYSSSLSEFTPNRVEAAYQAVITMDKYKTENYDRATHKELAESEATPEQLIRYIKLGDNTPNYRNAQRAILDLFRELDEYGQKIQTLQSTINPDSAGIGKSVLESMIKEDQVYTLFNNSGVHVSNATSLLGDMRMMTNVNEAKKLEEEGFVLRFRDNVIYAIKPETINGHAIVYGLFTANDMWSNLFPYQTTVVETMFERIENLTRSSENRINEKAERRRDIWNNFKSFIYSGKNLGLFNTTITAERQRILYDVWETQLINGIEESVRVKESLGSVIRRVKETSFGKNNPLISRLSVDTKHNGEPTLITYNAAAAENLDETDIYASFVDMLTRTDANGNSPVIGEFNKQPITMKELAQELILYAYITGGIQEAVQFIKYIPASFLTTISFANELGNTKFLEGNFGIVRSTNSYVNYYYNPPFVEQDIQHNAEQVPQVEFSDMRENNGKNAATLTTFKLTSSAIGRIGKLLITEQGADNVSPAYVTVRNPKAGKGLNLYKFDMSLQAYRQIDTLGSFANNEYNIDTYSQISLIRKNKANSTVKSVQKKDIPTGNPLGDIVESEENIDVKMLSEIPPVLNVLQDLSDGKVTAHVREDGVEATKEILNSIITTTDDRYIGYLAEEILDAVDQLPESMSVTFKRNPKLTAGGYYSMVENTETEDKAHTLVLSLNTLKERSRTEVAEVILHELIHGLTAYKVAFYELQKSGKKEKLAKLLEASPNLTLSKHEEEIIRSLEVLLNQARQKILSTPEKEEAYQNFVKKLASDDKMKTFKASEIGEFYGLTSLSEFITLSLTNAEFQTILNDIKAPSGKTFLQSLKERLYKLLKAILAIDIKEDSVLEQTLYDILDLITPSSKEREVVINQEGINISSYESGLGKELTNFASLPITFNGKKYSSSEAAYQAEKKVFGNNLSDENVLKLMTKIISAKLSQHPHLIDEIVKRGGITFLEKSTHNLIKNGRTIKEDRWTGQNGLFMRALKEAFQKEHNKPKDDGGPDVNQLPDDIIPFDTLDLRSTVSDREVKELMKQCK